MNIVDLNPINLKQQPNHKEEASIKLQDSLCDVGQILPIVITKDKVILRGARLRDAAFKAGMVSVTCVMINLTYNEWTRGSYAYL